MSYCMITFRSVTYAQRAEGELRRRGIPSRLQRTSRWMEEQGCGYSLRLRSADAQAAAATLEEVGIAYRKIYRLTESGEVEPVNQ